MLMQELWQRQMQWDEEVPSDIQQRWQKWTSDIPAIHRYPILRRYTNSQSSAVQTSLHGFSDASESAFGAVIYIRHQYTDGSVTTALVCSKAKVCPLKLKTIPQMELEAAKLLAQLLSHVAAVLQLPLNKAQPWTDSTIVLGWLQQQTARLKTFVANRVTLIRELLPDVTWRHVPTKTNPADLASRGATAAILLASDLWWSGPPWLRRPEAEWPSGVGVPLLRCLPELKATSFMSSATQTASPEWTFWTKYSDYLKLVRILAWMFRFINCCRKKKAAASPNNETLTFDELTCVKTFLLVKQQQNSFPEVYSCLKRKQQLPVNHSLAGLVVSVDSTHALIVKGRVGQGSDNKPREMHPLSLKNQLTKLMVETEHKVRGHPGIAALMSIIGHTYHIAGLKAYLKKVSRKCPKCRLACANPLQQQLGVLPPARTTAAPPFQRTGIDFAGPLTLREGSTRKPVLYKAYLCLFVCIATRAVHIEVCRSMDTAEFIAVFRKFCNRRGTPTEVYTDNGSNFVGAHTEIKQIKKLLDGSKQSISHLSNEQNVKWHFSPPRAPHFGGLWEAGVKSMKHQLRKLIAPHPLRLDELQAVLSEVEAILNSRPLVPADQVEPETGLVLTPAHFLIHRPLKAPPTRPAKQSNITTLTRWQLVQRLQQQLWDAWQGCYLQSLQSRSTWKRKKDNAKIGDIVFVKDPTLATGQRWPLGKITAVFPGQDKLVRTVEILCRGKLYKRPIHLLIPLIMEEPRAATDDVIT